MAAANWGGVKVMTAFRQVCKSLAVVREKAQTIEDNH
jgi:hypothetical protein